MKDKNKSQSQILIGIAGQLKSVSKIMEAESLFISKQSEMIKDGTTDYTELKASCILADNVLSDLIIKQWLVLCDFQKIIEKKQLL